MCCHKQYNILSIVRIQESKERISPASSPVLLFPEDPRGAPLHSQYRLTLRLRSQDLGTHPRLTITVPSLRGGVIGGGIIGRASDHSLRSSDDKFRGHHA